MTITKKKLNEPNFFENFKKVAQGESEQQRLEYLHSSIVKCLEVEISLKEIKKNSLKDEAFLLEKAYYRSFYNNGVFEFKTGDYVKALRVAFELWQAKLDEIEDLNEYITFCRLRLKEVKA